MTDFYGIQGTPEQGNTAQARWQRTALLLWDGEAVGRSDDQVVAAAPEQHASVVASDKQSTKYREW
jgi:hypothetical protein